MKKILITIALVAAAVSSQAQGWVSFFNSGGFRISTNSSVGGVAAGSTFANAGTVATTYYYALFVGTAGVLTGQAGTNAFSGAQTGDYAFQDSTHWTFDNPTADTANGFLGAAYATNSGSAGQFQSEVSDPNNSGNTYVHSSTAEDYIIVGWSANIGSTLTALEAWYADPTVTGWVGESQISGLISPSAGGTGLGGTLFGTSSPNVNKFLLGEIAPVPEPTTLALAGLGGLSMLLIRRRKS
jgi:hypothetical protein